MISEQELRRIAGRAGIGVGQAEHEYIMLCVLHSLAQTPPQSETFCLKGGTALRYLYFADWRHSVDLDFTVLPAFPAERLKSGLEQWFERVQELHGVEMSLRDYHRADGAARARPRFVGPLRHANRLLLDVTLDEPVVLPPQRRRALTDRFDGLQPRVLCYALEEILAEKLRSILQRGKARDYYDVWRLLREKGDSFDPETSRQVLRRKCEHKQLPEASLEAFLSPVRLQEAAAYWSRELIGQVPDAALPRWDAVVRELKPLLGDFLV